MAKNKKRKGSRATTKKVGLTKQDNRRGSLRLYIIGIVVIVTIFLVFRSY